MSDSKSPQTIPQVPLQIDYMENNVDETLSDIHVEPNPQLEINQFSTQVFGQFFKKPHSSDHSQTIHATHGNSKTTQSTNHNAKAIRSINDHLQVVQGVSDNLKVIQDVTGNIYQPKVNIPQKEEFQINIAILMVSVFMFAGFITGAILLQQRQTLPTGITLLIIPYIVYLVISLRCNSLLSEMKKLKTFEQYKQTYDQMVSTKPNFRFQIYCYHYKTVTTQNESKRQMVTTHTATYNYMPEVCVDQSKNIAGIKDITKYVFINYEKSFQFADNTSEEKFNEVYKQFIEKNKRDKYQDQSFKFELPGFVDEVGFCMQGHSPHNRWVFYFFTLIGLALPYSCLLERSISRYSIKIVKRIGDLS